MFKTVYVHVNFKESRSSPRFSFETFELDPIQHIEFFFSMVHLFNINFQFFIILFVIFHWIAHLFLEKNIYITGLSLEVVILCRILRYVLFFDIGNIFEYLLNCRWRKFFRFLPTWCRLFDRLIRHF